MAEARLRFCFDGRPLQARPGSSIAAALIENGIMTWRVGRGDGRRRGLFCGIGTCFDCLVVVGEGPAVRACVTTLAEGDEIATSVTPPRR
jgi:predicted molibdopterin-dependent oxidoreductase YjgC